MDMDQNIATEPLKTPNKTSQKRAKRKKVRRNDGIGCLPNLKWERFAVAVAGGALQREAYNSAGFRAKHPDQAASKLANRPEVAGRIKELIARIEKRSTKAAVERVAITKEFVMRELAENLERAKQVKGGSNIVNRAAELLGKAIGMFQDNVPPEPKTIEDLPTSVMESILANSTKKEPVQ